MLNERKWKEEEEEKRKKKNNLELGNNFNGIRTGAKEGNRPRREEKLEVFGESIGHDVVE